MAHGSPLWTLVPDTLCFYALLWDSHLGSEWRNLKAVVTWDLTGFVAEDSCVVRQAHKPKLCLKILRAFSLSQKTRSPRMLALHPEPMGCLSLERPLSV